jgi:TonB family protein
MGLTRAVLLSCLLAVGPWLGAQIPPDGPPRLLKSVKPEYPAALKEQRIVGAADLLCLIDEQGDVTEVSIERASREEFGRAAAEAVRRCKYQPAIKGGQPRAVRVRLPVNFDFSESELAEMDARRTGEILPPGPPLVDIAALDEWPELRKEVRPKTPAILARIHRMGQTVVRLVVDENGQPRDVRVLATTQVECSEAAVEAVRQCTFSPGKKDGKPVRVDLRLPVVFFPEDSWASGFRLRPGVEGWIDEGKLAELDKNKEFQPPRVIKRERPEFPAEMSLRRKSGSVNVEAIIDARGRVTHVHSVGESNQFFAVVAERALSRWKFAPAKSGDVAVPCRIVLPVSFTMMN